MDANNQFVEILSWDDEGYKPLVFSGQWQVALLNWELTADRKMVHELERHNQTDEVFILIQGTAALVISDDKETHIINAKRGMIYNVKFGTWHTVVGLPGSKWVIVENRDTHLHDVDIRQMNNTEYQSYVEQIEQWSKDQ